MSNKDPSDHDLLVQLSVHVQYIRSSLDEIKESVKDYPTTKQLLKNHLSNHRRREARTAGIVTTIATALSALITRLLSELR